MRTLKPIGYFILFILINQSCLDEADISTIPLDETINEISNKALFGSINDEFFSTDSIRFSIVEDQLLFRFQGMEPFLPDFLVLTDIPSTIKRKGDNFQMKIVNFTGVGSYALTHYNEDNDSTSVFQVEQFIEKIDNAWPFKTILSLQEESDYFTLEVKQIDLEQKRIKGNIFAQVQAFSTTGEQSENELKLIASFDAPLDFPTASRSNDSKPGCTLNGQIYGMDFCTANFRGKLSKDGVFQLDINPRDVFLPFPSSVSRPLQCDYDILSIELGAYTGPGVYLLSDGGESNNSLFFLHCLYDFDLYFSWFSVNQITDYAVLHLESVDLEHKRAKGYIIASLSRSSYGYYSNPFASLSASFDAPLEVE